MTEKMKAFVIDDDLQVRDALRILIEFWRGGILVGESSAIDNLLPKLQAARPDVVVLDWEMVEAIDDQIIRRIRKLEFSPQVMVLSCHPEMEQEVLRAGADWFACKIDPVQSVLDFLSTPKADV